MKIEMNLKSNPRCPLCGGTAVTYMATFPDIPEISYYQCDDCNTIRQDMVISDEEEFYTTSYRQILYPNSDDNISEREELTEKNRAKIQTELISHYRVDKRNPYPLHLDFGCGLGTLALTLQEEGVVSFSYGVELNEAYKKRANDLGVVTTATLEELPCDGFDLITLSHVLEHMSDPVLFIDRLIPYLNRGGMLFVDVPNATTNRNAYRPWHPVAYTPQTLSQLFGRWSVLEPRVTCSYPDQWQPVPENIVMFLCKQGG